MRLAGISKLNDDVSGNGKSINQTHWLPAISMSYQVARKSATVAQSVVEWENYNYHLADTNGVYQIKTSSMLHILDLGWIQTNSKNNKVFYNLTMNYSPRFEGLFPTKSVTILSSWGKNKTTP